MTEQEIEARIKAINYILDNELYNEDIEDEIIDDLYSLRSELKNKPTDSQEDTKESSEVESILEQRKSQYGDYNTFVVDMKNILNILATRKDSCKYDEEDIENFFFVLKLLRIQTASDLDSNKDLVGYAKLALERKENVRSNS